LICAGVCWLIEGDANRNATVSLEYRKVGEQDWKESHPLVRAINSNGPVDRSYFSKVNVPPNTWRFAGSVFDLTPDTEYELRARLQDPDGGAAEEVVKVRTRAEPPRLGGIRELYVEPGEGGGTGTKTDPYKGLAVVRNAVQPGDTVWFLPGEYKGPLNVAKNGEAGKPIVWRGAPEGEAVISGGIGATGRKFVTFDSLTIRDAAYGLSANNSQNVTLRYCKMEKVQNAMHGKESSNFYLADNRIVGNSTWPRTQGIEPTAGFDVGGSGHVVCHNSVRGVADGVSMLRAGWNVSVDFYHNEIMDCTDDGMETDYTDWNVRCFRNRLTNVFQGISCQPVRGGPTFIFRNIIYNVGKATFKLNNHTSGNMICHNTSFKIGEAATETGEPVTNSRYINNLFVGTTAGYGLNFGAPMRHCECDYNGVIGEKFNIYARWNGQNLPPLEKLREAGPIQRHGFFWPLSVKVFAGEIKPPDKVETSFPAEGNDPRLAENSPALDVGLRIPGINDNFKGAGPDLGAIEFGDPLPQYGPRPDPEKENR
jgi:hypothetical protein